MNKPTITRRTRVAAFTALGASAAVALTGFTPTVANALDASLKTAPHTAVPWSYQSPAGGERYTKEQALQQAKDFGLIAANKGVYGANVAAMKAANPNLELVAYVNGAYAQKDQGTAFPDSWYLRDQSGAKIRSHGYGNYLMDVSNAGWVKDVAKRCLSIMATGYHGCFLDMMGGASVMPGYGTGLPINPRTGQAYTKPEWLGLTAGLSKTVGELIGSTKPIYVNGIGSGPAYFNKNAPASQILAGVDGSLAEYWLRGAEQSLSAYPTETQWKQNVDMITDATAHGKTTLITVKTWAPGTAAQINDWHVYSLASYLMTADGTGQYQFMPSEADADMTARDALLDGLHIGVPSAKYEKTSAGYYQRVYTNGRVVVNPTKVAVTVNLGTPHTTTSGKTVTSLTLQPNGAQILTRA
jgi:hypothetical protein